MRPSAMKAEYLNLVEGLQETTEILNYQKISKKLINESSRNFEHQQKR